MSDKLAARERFLDVFEDLVEELKQILVSYNMPQEAIEWFVRSLNYNTPGGKLNRGLSVVDTFAILNNTTSDKLNDTEYKKVALLGWAIELLQAYFLVADDMMDQSKTRRGQPCWYLVEGVNNIAINDSFMLEGAIYILLKKHFRQDPYYVDLLDLFHEVTFQTELGQLLDLITADEEIVDLDKFSLEKHSFIVIFKTAYYSFYLPVALAMYMSGINDEKDLKQVRDILIPLGEYFQIQDDYLDCFGTPEQIGKIGTDIKDNKCSWVINQALLIATPEQRQLLDNNYGKKDDESEQKCKDLFKQLGIEKIYHDYEESIVAKLRKQIDQIDESRGLKKDVLTAFLGKVYKRSK
ncbi:farnesyl pyrophosphate synthase [Candida albicans P57072]|uniref:Farnesyl pyrophosphate synthase n=2 Tax=Candida albicans TaxID=5476 RepID=ERG20_CANAL|nr:bifunctional (2E,6E)-farnesyl diphosphate synthase/dimethylallyltranstransferase [Candida albicans SC5314]A0A1D8PH78.1 RecName: Full=Farnesyl pyrophosphate synthase; Short=FPP synthase; Short=FPS; AltName: Full=(2E,6E)-farnesyl diphosphate synthase; AltName: Full=Dimethylallyltranstransferase; AltName: Full=Farnesyl diphosphate synthase; AltName: Full=Geranyltranstransferase [Candida albicans SC5314]EEQ45876.1 farnesyl pyrophosphate synthetase [Candida albicans WO-1]KGR00072.1 farnesyl pyroph|eukprot:XP_712917.2 bifunctional (2E,6E)-farnesyl diphosphate synthase/dimethylallyltranstransferase [Candida albicans SC5314]